MSPAAQISIFVWSSMSIYPNILDLGLNSEATAYLPLLNTACATGKYFFHAVKVSLHVQFVCPINRPLTKGIFDSRWSCQRTLHTCATETHQGPLVITNIKLALVHQQTTTLIASNKNESMFKFVCVELWGGRG
jgi:hypothetical protein